MAVDITKLSDEDLSKKIKSAKVAVERNVGLIKEASERKLAKLEAELESRVKEVKEDVKEVEKKVEAKVKKVKKEAKKDVKEVEKAVEKEVKKVTKKPTAKKVKVAKKKAAKKPVAKKPIEKKVAPKTPVAKKEKKKKPRVYGSPTEKFELTIEGTVYKFSDLKSKEQCESAMKAVKARYSEVKQHRASTKAGIERASTIPVTKRITDSFASIAKKAVSEVPKTKISKHPDDIKKEIDALEKAFDNLFDKLGDLMGKDIPKNQRKQIMDILTKFEAKVEKGEDKKTAATSKVREKKEDGGGIDDGGIGTGVDGGVDSGLDMWGADNSWSYASLM